MTFCHHPHHFHWWDRPIRVRLSLGGKVEPSPETGCGSETSSVTTCALWFKLSGKVFLSHSQLSKPFAFPPHFWSCSLPLSFISCWIIWPHKLKTQKFFQGPGQERTSPWAAAVWLWFLNLITLTGNLWTTASLTTEPSAEDLCPAGEYPTMSCGSLQL